MHIYYHYIYEYTYIYMIKSDNEANKIRIMAGTLMECDELVERI